MNYFIIDQKGFSILEVMTAVVIAGLLIVMAVPNYQELKKNGYKKAAMAHLASYHRSAKIMIAEFGYNPGNFVAIGYEPEGDFYYRLIATDGGGATCAVSSPPSSCAAHDPPAYYPNQNTCISTEFDTGSNCNEINPRRWQELLDSYNTTNTTASVNGMSFKVYAASNEADDYFCADQSGVYGGDCP